MAAALPAQQVALLDALPTALGIVGQLHRASRLAGSQWGCRFGAADTGELAAGPGLRFDADAYTLLISASDGRLESAAEPVSVTLPPRVSLCVGGATWLAPRGSVPLALRLGAQLGACEREQRGWLEQLEALIGRILRLLVR